LRTSDWLLQGSVGKTYAAALAMQLIEEDQLKVDDLVSNYLGHYDWFTRLPNAPDITVRMIMNHTSGIMRYEFKESFKQDLTRNPDKVWKPEELLSYVLDEQPAFKAGADWEYSDTNYILLGMIIESLTGKPYYTVLRERILDPLQLNHTQPSDKRKLEGLAQGYAGQQNEFGGKEKVLDDQGVFVINPQFEWTGGGIYSTTADLARWGKLLYEGKAFKASLLLPMLDGVPAKLGREAKYGLGVIIRPTPLGLSYGHSGFFPGYLTDLVYFPEHKLSVAVQTNTSDVRNLKIGLNRIAILIAQHSINK
jgi:D-alanyl-D-alanine carboxypeptidase